MQFKGTAGSFFVTWLVAALCTYIPFVGPAIALNFVAEWLFKNLEVEGKQMHYSATLGESFKFTFVNALLIIVTLGIYVFWYVPKMYRYILDHVSYADAASPAPVPAPTPAPAAVPVQ